MMFFSLTNKPHRQTSPLGPNHVPACVQLWIYRRGFEPRRVLQALLFAFYFRCLFFSFSLSLVFVYLINLPHAFIP